MKTAKDLKIPFTWAGRSPILLDQFFYIPGNYAYAKQQVAFFADATKPLVIEYCSGNGQWIGNRAQQNPEWNWIAVEKKFERARQIWLKIHRESLSNLAVVCGEGRVFARYYAPTASEIFINFPDPWPKRRHAKHRLICAPFLQELLQIIRPGGKITCVTDDAQYAKEIGKEFSKCPHWKLLFSVNEWADYGRSYFKDLWTEKGRTITYVSYEASL